MKKEKADVQGVTAPATVEQTVLSGPVIPADPSRPAPLPAAPAGSPLTAPPEDGQKVLIDAKVPGTVRRGPNFDKASAPDLYAVVSPAHSKHVQFVRYPLARLFQA